MSPAAPQPPERLSPLRPWLYFNSRQTFALGCTRGPVRADRRYLTATDDRRRPDEPGSRPDTHPEPDMFHLDHVIDRNDLAIGLNYRVQLCIARRHQSRCEATSANWKL